MSSVLEVRGQSGQSYTFRPVEGVGLLPATGAVLIAAEPARSGWRVLKVGETDNLSRSAWPAELAQAVQSRRKAAVFFRLQVASARRAEELADLAPAATDSEAEAA